jgi:uncharacterized protein
MAVAALAAVALGWYYSSALENEALAVKDNADTFTLAVASIENGRVRLNTTSQTSPTGLWRSPGTFGVVSARGDYGQVGEVRELTYDHGVRDFTPLKGALAPGDFVRIDTFAFPDDPMQGLGLPFSTLGVNGPLGALPAWFVDAPTDDWAILVHGHRASRREMLRALQSVHAEGIKALAITYRNDEGAPQSLDHHLRFGATEWKDLDAAARYALDHGARRLFIVGNSMGGAITMSFLYRSPVASHVTAVVLDSSVLDFKETVRWQARDRAPGPVIAFGLWFSGVRFGLDWGATDYLSRASALSTPILLFHGTGDDRAPVATSQELARRRPELVTFISIAGVGHVRSWNADPAAYDRAIRTFLARYTGLR